MITPACVNEGSDVTVITWGASLFQCLEAMDNLLFMADRDIAKVAAKDFKQQGLDIKLGARLTGAEVGKSGVTVNWEDKGGDHSFEVDKLIIAVAAPVVIGGLSGLATARGVSIWYPTLVKPSFNPPAWIFGPVWSALYAMMGVAAWLVWRKAGFAGARLALGQVRFTVASVVRGIPASEIRFDAGLAAAGIGMAVATALVSALSGRPARNDVAMTGEVTLRGRVLPVGGIKMKVLAAHRAGLSTVILPKRNEKDLEDVPAEVRDSMSFILVDRIDEALEAALKLSQFSIDAADSEFDAKPNRPQIEFAPISA